MSNQFCSAKTSKVSPVALLQARAVTAISMPIQAWLLKSDAGAEGKIVMSWKPCHSLAAARQHFRSAECGCADDRRCACAPIALEDGWRSCHLV
jgi:hypothetical protein